MSKQDYDVLNLDEYASDEIIEARYRELKAKYLEDRFLVGEAGNDAARNLEKLETAYFNIKNERKERNSAAEDVSKLKDVERLIREERLLDAQALLDEFSERGAEWHYLQSVVFYKKNWMNESKKQLEIAMRIDANNRKYNEAYKKLVEKMDYDAQAANAGSAQYVNPNGAAGNANQQMGGTGFWENCVSCCYTYLCVNLLLNCCCQCGG